MKAILFALLSVSSLVACLDPGIERTPVPEASAVTQAVTSSVSQTCLNHCRANYEFCLEDAMDAYDGCLCFNFAVVCDRGCGQPGLPRECLSE